MSTPSPTHPVEGPLWTLGELHARAEAVLAAQEISPESGRVRAVPDERTLRYYTTIGLLATPALLKGRKAYYSRLHLAQIVAIKRLQALGMSLAQVQRELAGATPAELQSMAMLPEDLPEPAPAPAPAASEFWQEEAAAPGPRRFAPAMGTWAELAPGVVILLPPGTAIPAPALHALSRAALPLAAELRRQGLNPQADPFGGTHD